MGKPSFCRLKYFAWFCVALLSAFFTYQAFTLFRGAAEFSFPTLFLNTVIFLLLWGIAFTATSDFVEENVLMVLVIPAFGVYFINFLTFVTVPGTNLGGFLQYIGFSGLLLFASYRTRRFESYL